MKKLACLFLALSAAILMAQENQEDSRKKLTREEAFEKMMTATGGFLETDPSGARIIIVDGREKRDNAPARAVKVLRNTYRISVTNSVQQIENAKCPALAVREMVKSEKALMVIAIIDSDTASSLTIMPEDRSAVVNAARCGIGATDDEKEERIVKEIWRAIGFISGVGYSTDETSVMQALTSPVELDNCRFQVLKPGEMQRLRTMMDKFGSKLGRRTTYKQAVKEGWAPAPTNSYQKAIWDNIRTNTVNKVGAK